MNAPALTYTFAVTKPGSFSDLDLVRLTQPATTDEGETVPAGARGTVVGIWSGGKAYEVEFEAGLVTVEASILVAA